MHESGKIVQCCLSMLHNVPIWFPNTYLGGNNTNPPPPLPMRWLLNLSQLSVLD